MISAPGMAAIGQFLCQNLAIEAKGLIIHARLFSKEKADPGNQKVKPI
jgi:hypothetical protein